MTALTVNGSAAAATTLVAAGKLFAATGGTSGNTSTKVGTSTGYKHIYAKGFSGTSLVGAGSLPAPTDSNFNGWLWDVTTLEGQRLAAGTWTPTIHLLASTGTTVTPTVEWYKRSSGGVYTQIGTVTGSSIALTTSSQLLVFTAPSLALMDFATGDKLVMWLWVNQTAGGATNSTISVVEATSGSSAGVASEAQAVTPGYAPTPVALSVAIAGSGTVVAARTLSLYGSNVADAILIHACDMASVLGGSETSTTDTFASGGVYAQITSQPNTVSGGASITPPTGYGWVYSPGAGTIIAGNWSANVTLSAANWGTAGHATVTLRFFTYVSSVYTLIGSISVNLTGTAKTTYSFPAMSLSATPFGASDLLYIDLWWFDDNLNTSGDNPTVYLSSSALGGVANDLQVTIPGFTGVSPFALATALSVSMAGAGTLSATLSVASTTVALSGECDGAGLLTGTLTVTTALTGTLAGTGTLSPTLSATLALPAATLSGVGTLAGTEQLTTALASTMPGVGALVPTLAVQLSLPTVTLAGMGTLAGTEQLTTALAVTIPGVATFTAALAGAGVFTATMNGAATLTGTMALATNLTATMTGSGQLSPTLAAKTALTGQLAGAGTLTGGITASVPLTTALSGTGTAAFVFSLQTALSVTSVAAGTLSGAVSLGTALFLTCAGAGTLTAQLVILGSLAATCAGSGTCAGALSFPGPSATATWKTRDLRATWVTRDEKAGWETRDLETTWKE